MRESPLIDKSLALRARSQPNLAQATSAHAAEHRRGTLLSSVPTAAPDKMSLRHVMNLIELGNFEHELEFNDQKLIVDKILELYQFYAIYVPHTFKQAMKSPKKDKWMKRIAVELNNLEEMRV
jgi:hypothetical protein